MEESHILTKTYYNNMKLRLEESSITGKWIWDENHKKVINDTEAKRVEYLVANYLTKITVPDWETLYQDPYDKRYWELKYLQSELHGGGPPSLILISMEDAKTKYGI